MAIRPDYRGGTMARPHGLEHAEIDEGLRKHMLSVYNYMALGLVVSGAVAWAITSVPAINQLFYQVQGGYVVGVTPLYWIGVFAPLGLLMLAGFAMRGASLGTMQMIYWAFVALQGVGISLLLQLYTGESVVRVFLITAAAFGGLSLYGYTTRRNLSGFGSFLVMGLIGLIIASLVNMFLPSTMMTFMISAAGVLIFAGLIAYDTQRIKVSYVAGDGTQVNGIRAVWGALSLYINFLNLFQFLLMFLGNRN